MCLGAIYWARPKAVYYACSKEDAANIGFDDQFIYEELDLAISSRKMPLKQMLRDEAKLVFDNWQNKQDKTDY
jgi:guanine deaminase